MSIRITCDGCGKKRVLQPDFYILNIQYPFNKSTEPITRHLCSSCEKKVIELLANIEPYKEPEVEVDLVNPNSYRSNLIIKASGIDIRKIIAFRKAGWTIELICKEIDIDRSDIITEICQYFDKTKDEFKDCKKGYKSDSYDYENEVDDIPTKKQKKVVEVSVSEDEQKLDSLIEEFYGQKRLRMPLATVKNAIKSSLRKDAKPQMIADRLAISVTAVVQWRDGFAKYVNGLEEDK